MHAGDRLCPVEQAAWETGHEESRRLGPVDPGCGVAQTVKRRQDKIEGRKIEVGTDIRGVEARNERGASAQLPHHCAAEDLRVGDVEDVRSGFVYALTHDVHHVRFPKGGESHAPGKGTAFGKPAGLKGNGVSRKPMRIVSQFFQLKSDAMNGVGVVVGKCSLLDL
ncbi:hypothetical protein ACIU1J_31860 [Azospirillum doebereinerae]|uniref:hypothetical protein n=1 Tax=Azospirillum doebereinerae TaxID=92933 RepID=UPI00384DDF36